MIVTRVVIFGKSARRSFPINSAIAVAKVSRSDFAVAADASRREDIQDQGSALSQAAKFYRAQLKESHRAIEYLKGRGLTGAIAARYGIGYAPDAASADASHAAGWRR